MSRPISAIIAELQESEDPARQDVLREQIAKRRANNRERQRRFVANNPEKYATRPDAWKEDRERAKRIRGLQGQIPHYLNRIETGDRPEDAQATIDEIEAKIKELETYSE